MNHVPPRRTILLVDDSEPARELVYWSLGGPSSLFQIIPAPSGDRALDILHKSPADVVIVDVHMPGMDGFDLLSAMQTSPRLSRIPVIMMSAENDAGLRMRAREAGAAFLGKPFSPTELLKTVNGALEGEAVENHLGCAHLTVQTLLDAIPHLAMILDEHHRVVMGNDEFFRHADLGISNCPVHCATAVHGPTGEPTGCPLTESVETGVPCERSVSDPNLGDLLVSVYPLDIVTEDGRRLYFHVARG